MGTIMSLPEKIAGRINTADAVNPAIVAAKVGKEVAISAFDEYTAYQSFANKLEAVADKKLFEFETKKLDAVHKRNKLENVEYIDLELE